MWVNERLITHPAGHLYFIAYLPPQKERLLLLVLEKKLHEQVVDLRQLLLAVQRGKQLLAVFMSLPSSSVTVIKSGPNSSLMALSSLLVSHASGALAPCPYSVTVFSLNCKRISI